MNNLTYTYKKSNKKNKGNEKIELFKKKLLETKNKDTNRYNFFKKQILDLRDNDNVVKINDNFDLKSNKIAQVNTSHNDIVTSHNDIVTSHNNIVTSHNDIVFNIGHVNHTLCDYINIKISNQDEYKQDEYKQDECKQDKCKQDKCKQDKCKQDKCKQDKCKQDECKQDECKQHTINDLKMKNIITINNVFQPKYKYNKHSKGLGDFIRGSYFLIQFCELYNFKLNIMFNTIYDFLDNTDMDLYNITSDNIISDNIVFLDYTNWLGSYIDKNNMITPVLGKNYINNFIKSIMNIPVYDTNIYICSTLQSPLEIKPKHIEIMQKHLKPNKEMSDLISETLIHLKLMKNNYIVIHIRTGDKYLVGNIYNMNNNFVEKIINEINQIINSNTRETNYLLMSDNVLLKRYLIHIFPFLKTTFVEITHLGEGVELDKLKVKNTLIDFYLMSTAKKICAFSVYNHGTGFSQWVAITYNIPYSCKLCK